MNPSEMVKSMTDEQLAQAAKSPRTSLGRHAVNEIMNRMESAPDSSLAGEEQSYSEECLCD